MLERYSDLITVKDLREILHIGKDKAYCLIHNNQVKSFTIGRNIKILKNSVIEFIENNC